MLKARMIYPIHHVRPFSCRCTFFTIFLWRNKYAKILVRVTYKFASIHESNPSTKNFISICSKSLALDPLK